MPRINIGGREIRLPYTTDRGFGREPRTPSQQGLRDFAGNLRQTFSDVLSLFGGRGRQPAKEYIPSQKMSPSTKNIPNYSQSPAKGRGQPIQGRTVNVSPAPSRSVGQVLGKQVPIRSSSYFSKPWNPLNQPEPTVFPRSMSDVGRNVSDLPASILALLSPIIGARRYGAPVRQRMNVPSSTVVPQAGATTDEDIQRMRQMYGMFRR